MKRILCSLLIIGLSTQLNAQCIDSTRIYHVPSQFTGQEYELFVSVPQSYRDKDTTIYPIVYVLDGNFMFRVMQTAYSALRDVEAVRDMIIVGVGYKGSSTVMQSMENRTPDYTPSKDTAFERMLLDYKLNVRTGEAAKFATALQKEIIPFVETKYRTKERGLAGHSFGGLFGAYALFNEPSLFQNYILSSVSLEWHNFKLLQVEKDFYTAGNRNLSTRVLITVGEEEDKARMIDPMKKFVNAIREHAYNGLSLTDRIIRYEDHSSAYLAAFSQGLKLLYKKSPN
ncbi:MAG: alpha/beta hydrolase-fold protein [Bacteroidota bacterium]|nr:alpha/beta hydrolase-fold protein [Bacteroidota bacterium]